MKKKLIGLFIGILLPIASISNSSANETNNLVGGYAVVDTTTGIVYGVIVAESSDPFNNGGTMPGEYMGCPAGCSIVQQSTADKNGNVSGIRTDESRQVSYNADRNVFQISELNVSETRNITEFADNASITETDITVSRSAKYYEFGVQDFTDNTGQFQMTEVTPPQNTTATISATTTQYTCSNQENSCTRILSNTSNILNDELLLFNERSTNIQVQEKINIQSKNKIKEQISLILNMLGAWIIN